MTWDRNWSYWQSFSVSDQLCYFVETCLVLLWTKSKLFNKFWPESLLVYNYWTLLPVLRNRDIYPMSRFCIFSTPFPGSASKNLSTWTQKIVPKLSKIWSGLFIPDPDSDFLPIPDPGSKGYRIRSTYWYRLSQGSNFFNNLPRAQNYSFLVGRERQRLWWCRQAARRRSGQGRGRRQRQQVQGCVRLSVQVWGTCQVIDFSLVFYREVAVFSAEFFPFSL